MKNPCVIIAVCGLAATAASGQLTITTDFTQNGGALVIPNGPERLTIGHPSNNPLLTLTNGAITTGAWSVGLGATVGSSGRLRLEQNSFMSLVPNGLSLPTVRIGEVFGGTGHATVRTGSLLRAENGVVFVGDYGFGTLVVEQGGRVQTRSLIVAADTNAQGTVLVTGANSRIDLSTDLGPSFDARLVVGSVGTLGTMIISDGGVVTVPDDAEIGVFGTGLLSIFDAGSTLVVGGALGVGAAQNGQGSVNVSGGATLISGGATLGARSSGKDPVASGVVTVTGSGTTWANNGDLTLGTADLIGPAAFPSSGALTVANNATVINTGRVTVGRTSSGNLTVSGGATLSASGTDAFFPYGVVIALTDTSTGQATVTGAGSAININGGIIVGNAGVGSLSITNGGSVTNDLASVAFFQAGVGQVTVSGANSRWTSTDNVSIGGNESQFDTHLHGGQATLVVRDGGVVQSQGSIGLTVYQLSSLSGGGGTITANTVHNRGVVSPGDNGAGVMTIAGSYNQTATGRLMIELGGTTPGFSHDQLIITNLANLDGALQVALIDGFALGFNQTFDILTSGNALTGQFTDLPGGALVGTYNGIDLFIRYSEIKGPAGNGGLVSLYTIPTPGAASLLALAGCAAARRRRRD